MNILPVIRKNIDQHSLIPEGSTAVLAVSGGADSIALLHAFRKLDIPFTVVHVNHQLRGKESDDDELFVQNLTENFSIPISVHSINVRKLAQESGDSIEIAARKARHTAFSGFKGSVIALAHHADDQAETFLLKLARGAGPDGLSGMALSQKIGQLNLIRPMLNIPRSEIIKWLESEKYAWREDSSNSDCDYLRNRIRHSVLPMLEKELNPNMRKSILRTMNILREENASMDKQAGNRSLENCNDPALRRRLLRKWLFEQGAEQVSFEAAEQILNLINSENGTTVFELNRQQRVIIEYGIPRFEEGPEPEESVCWDLITEPSAGWRSDSGIPGKLPAEACFNMEKVGDSPIKVRSFLPGDFMSPLGMEGTRKLQDIFTDLKIPRSRRCRIPVVICRNEIIWIPGYRIARDWAVPNQTSPSVLVRIEQKKTG